MNARRPEAPSLDLDNDISLTARQLRLRFKTTSPTRPVCICVVVTTALGLCGPTLDPSILLLVLIGVVAIAATPNR